MAMLFLAFFAMVGGCRTPRVAVVDEPQVDPMTVRLSERLKREVGYSVRSGLCRVEGEEVLLIESDLTPDVQVDLLVGLLATRDLSLVNLSPDTRRLIEGA